MFTNSPLVRWLPVALLAIGCTQQMDNQPSLEPLESSEFFEDGRASRPWIEGTIARGHSPHEITSTSEHLDSGAVDGQPAATLPEEVTGRWTTEQLLERGQERYMIFCAHCHGMTGDGQGIVPQRGFPQPPTYHSQRLRAARLGHIVQVIRHGRGRMPAHGGQVPAADRWAIAAYVRALQLSQHAETELLNQNDLTRINDTNPDGQ